MRLQGQVRVRLEPSNGGEPILFVTRMPAKVRGHCYRLVTFPGPTRQGDGHRVRHYDRAAGGFSRPEEAVRLLSLCKGRSFLGRLERAGGPHDRLLACLNVAGKAV